MARKYTDLKADNKFLLAQLGESFSSVCAQKRRLVEDFRRYVLAMLTALLLASCNASPNTLPPATPTARPTEQPTSTPTPPPPSPEATAAAYLNAWEVRDYAAMYALLTPESQATISPENFARRYQDALTTATVLTVTARPQSSLHEESRARVSFTLTLETALVGDLSADVVMALSLRDERWGVEWDAGLIWPQLSGGNYFRMRHSAPTRANIYDRGELALATKGTVVTIGVIPGQIEDGNALLQALETVTGIPPNEIKDRYANAQADWKVPITDVPAEVSVEYNELLSSIPGVYRDEKEGRTYPRGSAAPHVVGWVAPVPAERLDDYRALGYRGDEWVGASGLEAWGEEILAGRHGGRLTVVTGEGEVVSELAEHPPLPSRAIYTTFDREFQKQVQEILGDRKGAIVVLEANTGAVRALASGPPFDANVFSGPIGAVDRSEILADPRHPLFNRATQGTYPTGSVFKIITMAAGMEEAGMDPDGTFFYCPGYWDGLGRAARKLCWKEDGHGDISLKDALSGSCNVTFYSVGHVLDGMDQSILPRFGRDFGFGEKTGIVGVAEESGLMPSPTWKTEVLGEQWWPGDTINLSIGQGDLKATPLQVARMVAAVANGGTLYRPYVVGRIEASTEEPEEVIQPEAAGTLPISAGHLAAIQEGMLGVTSKAIGTASNRFYGLGIPVAGKTGTAESGGPDSEPHSWFAAYAPADNPEIALVVLAENGGEGSTVAAPLARQVIEAYYGLALSPLPPQAEEDYVPPTPTP